VRLKISSSSRIWEEIIHPCKTEEVDRNLHEIEASFYVCVVDVKDTKLFLGESVIS
jgi:hypothetical protein